MKRLSPSNTPRLFFRRLAGIRPASSRSGSTLLIVMVLLGMLSLIGFLFYTFAAQEKGNAAYWADANKVYTASTDEIIDFFLEQLIVGPPPGTLTQSALYGRRHSLLPTAFGTDTQPYNSAGIHLGSNGGLPFVDMDRDGTDDYPSPSIIPDPQNPLNINDSAVANGGTYPRNLDNDASNTNPYTPMPDSGVDYTYPDINNVWLAYKGYAIDQNGHPALVIIPSFHRPQLLRTTGGQPINDWWSDSSTAGKVLRPHPYHTNPDGSYRYPLLTSLPAPYPAPPATLPNLTTAFPFNPNYTDYTSGTAGNQGVWSLTSNFVYGTTTLSYEWDVDNDGDGVKEGVWLDCQYPIQTTSSGQKYVPLVSFTVYDADGLFNLNAHGNLARLWQLSNDPSISTKGTGTIADLYNSTVAGHSLPIDYTTTTTWLSASNQGHGPSEVNPQYALNTDPTIVTPSAQYQYQFGNAPTDTTMASNMDWYRLMTGTANFQSANSFNDLYPGRFGEGSSVLYNALQEGITNGSVSQTKVNEMPGPGTTGVDDNWNQYEGGAWVNPASVGSTPLYPWEVSSYTPGFTYSSPTVSYQPSGQNPVFFPTQIAYYPAEPMGQPMDYNGDGYIYKTDNTYGKSREAWTYSRMTYQRYTLYDNAGGTSNYTAAGSSDPTNLQSVAAGWYDDISSGALMLTTQDATSTSAMISGPGSPITSTQIDDPLETTMDPARADPSDSIFGVDENAGLHLSPTDRTNLSLSSRPRTLAPLNLIDSTRADTSAAGDNGLGIAQRFTTLSFDRKQHGLSNESLYLNTLNNAYSLSLPLRRAWELSDLNSDLIPETFPPKFGSVATYSSTDPLRAPVRKLLEMQFGNADINSEYQFRLSFNHLTTVDNQGNVIQRGLTPHDPNLTASVVTSADTQEWTARLDRQQMARDIYVMLYLLGGGLDYSTQNGVDGVTPIGALGYTGDNSAFNLYTDRQLREMAQFAVNLVDSLDSDHVMTKFEYDKNLGNGWNLDDNAYTTDSYSAYLTSDNNYNADYPEDGTDRGVVYGVEAQSLTISEAMSFYCQALSMDHAATNHDDTKLRYYTYIELRNIGLDNVDFTNGQWRIRVIPNVGSAPYSQRAVTILNGTKTTDGTALDTLAPGSLFVIGNAGETDSSSPAQNINQDLPPANQTGMSEDLDHSRFRCDNTSFAGSYVPTDPKARIAPTGVDTTLLYLNLDLLRDRGIAADGLQKFRLVDLNTTLTDVSDDTDITTTKPGGLLNDTNMSSTPNAAVVELILERRQYPDRPSPTFNNQTQESDNPWIPVDRYRPASSVTQFFTPFNLVNADTMESEYDNRLKDLVSQERKDPLDGSSTGVAANNDTSTTYLRNSISSENFTSPAGAFTYMQNLFDRPLATAAEVLHIPLFGPNNLTNWVARSWLNPLTQTTDFSTNAGAYLQPGTAGFGTQAAYPFAATAAGKILQPEDYNNLNAGPGSKFPVYDNRWYRLLEFFEVPTRTHRQLGNPLEIVRAPGKLNLNTIRHIDVLAGLLDDTEVMALAGMSTSTPSLTAKDTTDTDSNMPTGRRDWWVQFLQSRDGRRVLSTGDADANSNPFMRIQPDNVTDLYLPGLADSNPFRSLSSAGFSYSAGQWESPQYVLDQTIFRRLPIDMTTTYQGSGSAQLDKRHLWEVGNQDDHKYYLGAGAGQMIDPVLRHRLLSKIYNNSTTRSNVFLVFATIQYFEADDTNGSNNVQIGGPLAGSTPYRGFFVIDRSQPEDGFSQTTGTVDYRALIKYRLRIQ